MAVKFNQTLGIRVGNEDDTQTDIQVLAVPTVIETMNEDAFARFTIGSGQSDFNLGMGSITNGKVFAINPDGDIGIKIVTREVSSPTQAFLIQANRWTVLHCDFIGILVTNGGSSSVSGRYFTAGDTDAVPAGDPGPGENTAVATVSTTGAAATTIYSVSVAESESFVIEASVAGQSSSNRIGKKIAGVFYRPSGGDVAQQGSTQSLWSIASGGAASWDLTLVANTATENIDVKVTGAAATDINWKVSLKYIKVS